MSSLKMEVSTLKTIWKGDMNTSASRLVTHSAAEVYEEFFVPALFHQWAGRVVDAAAITAGQRVLDVACGTGVLACAAAERAGSSGSVVGLDLNPEMLAVARRKGTHIEWRDGRAESIPFPNESFDAVVSQFGIMFFEDRHAALREMYRVLRPSGGLAVALCDALDHSPGYAVLAELLQRLFGVGVADAFRAPFMLGDAERLHGLCTEAGIAGANVTQYEGEVRFASVKALVATERACIWTLGGMLDDNQFERLLKEAQQTLKPFVTSDGSVVFTMPALIVTATKL